MTVLVTGGAGYIGTHTLIELQAKRVDFVVLDNFSNSSVRSLDAASRIMNAKFEVVEGDIRNAEVLNTLFRDKRREGRPITSVVHFAALKSLGESLSHPLEYYDNNVCGSVCLLKAMLDNDVHRFVFSSSAAVYGVPHYMPYDEKHPVSPTTPYGRTKAIFEEVLNDYAFSNPRLKVVNLRYFNPIGAHPSGLIGESASGTPNNLFPYIAKVACGSLSVLRVFGTDYSTYDGSGVRDYIHVVDLAEAHAKAVTAFDRLPTGVTTLNLGTGKATSVLELVRVFEETTGQSVPLEISPRRAGDLPEAWADPTLARKLLGWAASRDLATMCRDGWNWQKLNPDGFDNDS